ncbi:MAG: Phosphoesterase, PA-phosphatase related protein [Candidatus Peribacteria bacterium]|nr:Phosphoesterase, PA-phosphatase related protein [Candidatus Peribacteria bacterium]
MNGENILSLAQALWKAVITTFLGHPSIHKWLTTHPRFIQFFQARFTKKSFYGLSLTILVIAFLYTVALLAGIIQDYLVGDPLIEADKRLANLLFAFRTPSLVHAFYFITLFAEASVIVVMSLLLTALFWWKRLHIFIVTLWLTLITSEGAAYLGKLLFHRLRPDQLLRAIEEDSFSFPSGHATTVMAFYGVLAYVLIRTHRSWLVRTSCFFGAVAMVIIVDFSRLYLGVHYLSDVLAGDLLGLAALIFAISVTEWLLWKNEKQELSFTLPLLAAFSVVEVCVVSGLFFFAHSPWTKAQQPQLEHIKTDMVLSLFQKGTLPLYTETLVGNHQEPINLIVIAKPDCLPKDFAAAHWGLADVLSYHSLKQAAKAVLFNQADATAPMTPSFYDARPHDMGFEKQTEKQTVRARHHARFWKTRYETESGALFVGTISLDTDTKWGGITHTIAPDIDTERNVFVSDLKKAGVIQRQSDTQFIAPTLGKNFSGDAFFTDGKAVFLALDSCKS